MVILKVSVHEKRKIVAGVGCLKRMYALSEATALASLPPPSVQ